MTTRKVLYSPGFGAGWASWNSECGKALAEDSELIKLVEAGKHTGRTPDTRWRENDYHECSPEFFARAMQLWRAGGQTDHDSAPYFGGVNGLKVCEVDGPYRIVEYDGSESIEIADRTEWW
jgi:hypothetical protein